MKLTLLAAGAALVAVATDAVTAKSISARLVGGIRLYAKPTVDTFYKIPDNVATFKEGAIIRERDVTLAVGAGTGGILSFSKATQLLFRTQTATGDADATVTTVFKPNKPVSPPKIVSVALFEDSASKDCANSYALLKGGSSQQTTLVALQTSLVSALLNKGYYVTAPDYEGSQAAFIAGYAESRVQLDSIRAILNHKPTIANPSGSQVILNGYSGGGHSAGWAAQLWQEYAPEINIIGGAYGGLPVDLFKTLVGLNKGLFAGFGLAGIGGVANAYPELKTYLDQHLLPNGTQALKFLRSDQGCVLGELATFALKDYYTYLDTGMAFFLQPIVQKYLNLNLLGGRGAKDIINKFPRYIFHANADEVIPIDPVRQYVADQCAGGASINFSVSQGTDHVLESANNIPGTVQWITSRFEGTLQQSGCTNTTHNLIGAEGIMGPAAYTQLIASKDVTAQKLKSMF